MPSKDAATPSRCLIFPVRNSDTANHTADAMLENKVYFCKEDMLSLLETAETLIPDDLLKDHTDDPDIYINTEAWGRYKKILYGFMAAEYSGWRISCIRHAEAPSLVHTYSSIMITLPKSCTFTDEAKTAMIMAMLLSDRIITATEKGKTQICFTVDNIR